MEEDRQPLLAAGDSGWSSPTERVRRSPHVAPKKSEKNVSNYLDVIFVVSFDIKKGNVVEWSYPKGHNLEGLEFKALASGLHNLPRDFIYFRYMDWYGLSCYQKLSVDSEEERGVRMKCVGVLAECYHNLGVHMEFLRRQVKHQLEHPEEYGSLREYAQNFSLSSPLLSGYLEEKDGRVNSPQMSSLLEGQSLSELIQEFLADFGPFIFVLWKLALLQKRILFYSTPPVGKTCLQVYFNCLMTSHQLRMEIDTDPHPQFYISVSDIELLRSKRTYIACTTEHIMQSKEDLFDVLVANRRITSPSSYVEPLLMVTRQDQARFRHLQEIVNNSIAQSKVSGISSQDHGFVK
jgi:hypothetical protein